jgi:NAD(P)H-flavin reductase
MSIKKLTGVITATTDLSPTAKEVTLTLDAPLTCLPGSFINLFMDVDGVQVRRAYSVVHTDTEKRTLTIAVRHTLTGTMTPEFWKPEIIGRAVTIMGPMGVNTADTFTHPHVFLFAFGIGAGVIRAVADYAQHSSRTTSITIVTGSRNEEDIIYKTYFDALQQKDPRISVRYVLSDPSTPQYPYTGYIQNNIDDLVYNDADIYMCGQVAACDGLMKKIQEQNPQNVTFFFEAFH